MSVMSGDELRKLVEWARNNGQVTHEASGGIRLEHDGEVYVLPAELLREPEPGGEEGVDLSAYLVHDA